MRWVVAVGLLVGCLDPELVECPGGIVCPKGDTCGASGCISADQQAACGDVAPGGACNVGGLSGVCRDGICEREMCGNAIVEAGEACDDGNAIGGDGCAVDCTVETCGNGVVDRSDEACDDGDLVSRDGCDSRCLAETETWTLAELGPLESPDDGSLIYDTAGARLVYLGADRVWQWDGIAWTNIAPLPANATIEKGGYDAVTQHVIAFGYDLATFYELVGTTWITHTSTLTPTREAIVTSTATNGIFAFIDAGRFEIWSLDVAASAWTRLGVHADTASSGGLSFAYDEDRDTFVIAIGQINAVKPKVYEVVRSTMAWSSELALTVTPTNDWALQWDPIGHRILAFGGAGSREVNTWDVATKTWSHVDTMPFDSHYVGTRVAYDAGRGRFVVFVDYDIGEWTGDTQPWSHVRVPLGLRRSILLAPEGRAVFDSHRHRQVYALRSYYSGKTYVTTYTFDGVWRSLPELQVPAELALAYDPERDVTVLASGAQTWKLDDAGWTPFVQLDGDEILAMAYIPTRHAILATANAMTYELASDGVAFTPIATQPAPFAELAYDARADHAVATDGEITYVLDGTTWGSTLSLPGHYRTITDERRGAVAFVAPGLDTWERSIASWTPHPKLPFDFAVTSAGYDPIAGELVVAGIVGTDNYHAAVSVVARRRFASATPDESCLDPATDADGDGLAGCADPDCYWACDPACPPFVSCP